ncbi:hypothetical protein HAX54_040358 [Datura stramonium]|uniref:Uncharacterized protein n=1 Tax=Datura stramonium TaxID=4076 RepID=A0ABS8SKC5_DATST|nr:hypothetical protein [Datura stramonium]
MGIQGYEQHLTFVFVVGILLSSITIALLNFYSVTILMKRSLPPLPMRMDSSSFDSVLKFFTQGPIATFPRVTNYVSPVEDHLSKHCTPTVVTDELPPRQPFLSISETDQPLSQSSTSVDTNQNSPISPEIYPESLPINHSLSHSTPPPPPVMPARRSSRHHNVPGYLKEYSYTLPNLHTSPLSTIPSNHQTALTTSYPDNEQALRD